MALKTFIFGASGRVGQHLIELTSKDQRFEWVGGFARSDQRYINDLSKAPAEIDLVVDFSLPEALPEVVSFCQSKKAALVSGTTGLKDSHFKQLDQLSKDVPVLWAPNMSLGVAFLRKLIAHLGELKDFDFQIEEFHHRHKLDAPSGTALRLQEDLKKAVKVDVPEPVAIRGGGIFGLHRVFAMSEEEQIVLEHQALNRAVFAKGALEAAAWVTTRPAGRYQLEDVLQGPA